MRVELYCKLFRERNCALYFRKLLKLLVYFKSGETEHECFTKDSRRLRKYRRAYRNPFLRLHVDDRKNHWCHYSCSCNMYNVHIFFIECKQIKTSFTQRIDKSIVYRYQDNKYKIKCYQDFD